MDSGPGVVICEPVSGTGVDKATANFGAGCGRWLQFVVGGQGELGKTPIWEGLDRARRELGRSDFRLSPAAVPRLRTILGATHAATGTLVGSAGNCTLVYQLCRLDGMTPCGPPVSAKGSTAKIIQQLPAMAVALSKQLGVKTPHLAGAVDASPAELALVGASASEERYARSSLEQEFTKLARRMPLAAIIGIELIRDTGQDFDIMGALTRLLLQTSLQTPSDNVLCLGEIAWAAPEVLIGNTGALSSLLRVYPRNLNLLIANSHRQLNARDSAAAILTATECTRNFPLVPESWHTLGVIHAEVSGQLRNARTADKLTPNDWKLLGGNYSKALAADRTAIRLDPQDGQAWYKAAVDATFASDFKFADEAIWNALALCRGEQKVYWWGLEMFQSKWIGDEHKRLRIANAAASDTTNSAGNTYVLANTLNQEGYWPQAKIVYARAIGKIRARIGHGVDDLAHIQALGTSLTILNRLPEATKVYEDALKEFPTNERTHALLGGVLYVRGMWNESLKVFRDLVKINSRLSLAHAYVGQNLNKLLQYDEADRESRLALQIDPNSADAHYALAGAHFGHKNYEQAITECVSAINGDRSMQKAYLLLVRAEIGGGKTDTALLVAKDTAKRFSSFSEPYAYLGAALLAAKQLEQSEAECRKSLKMNAESGYAHEQLGNVLLARGHRAEAKAEWTQVVKSNDMAAAKEAREKLAKYP